MTNETTESAIRVLKVGSGPSLSGKSKLSYEVGCGPESDLQIRVSKNTGSGYFSKDWIAWEHLQRVLEKNAGKPITSHTLSPLFQGRSVNTAGFLLAALKQEGLVQPMVDKRRCYECLDGTAFMAEVHALMGSPGVAPKSARAKSAAVAKKAIRPLKR